jgi:hypothetical protein
MTEVGMAMEDERNLEEPTVTKLADFEKDHSKTILAKLEASGIRMLWSFVERDASTWRFWIKVTVVMLVVNTALPIAGYLFFLGRDLGYFD